MEWNKKASKWHCVLSGHLALISHHNSHHCSNLVIISLWTAEERLNVWVQRLKKTHWFCFLFNRGFTPGLLWASLSTKIEPDDQSYPSALIFLLIWSFCKSVGVCCQWVSLSKAWADRRLQMTSQILCKMGLAEAWISNKSKKAEMWIDSGSSDWLVVYIMAAPQGWVPRLGCTLGAG